MIKTKNKKVRKDTMGRMITIRLSEKLYSSIKRESIIREIPVTGVIRILMQSLEEGRISLPALLEENK